MLDDQDFNEYEYGKQGILVRQIELAEVMPEEMVVGEQPEMPEDIEMPEIEELLEEEPLPTDGVVGKKVPEVSED